VLVMEPARQVKECTMPSKHEPRVHIEQVKDLLVDVEYLCVDGRGYYLLRHLSCAKSRLGSDVRDDKVARATGLT